MSVTLLPDPHISFRLATVQDVPNILNLIEKVRANLNDAQQHFLKDKNAAEIVGYIESKFPTVLAFKNGQLAGVAISTLQDPSQGLGATNLPENFNRGHFMCIGTVAVDPDFRAQGIGAHMISRAFDETARFIREQDDTLLCGVIAKVSTENTGSQRAFLANEFNQGFATHTDPQGGYQFNVFNRSPISLHSNSGVSDENLGIREQRAQQIRVERGLMRGPTVSRG